MSKYKLKCFNNRYHKFNSKEDIFRNEFNHPICAECLIEFLEESWEDEFAEYIFTEIKNKFNRNYNKWFKWFHKNHTQCESKEEHGDYSSFYESNDCITIIDGKKYCRYCIDEFKENEPIKIKTEVN